MMSDVLDKLGDINPQLLREIKGRLKLFPVIFTLTLSIVFQFIICFFQVTVIENYSRELFQYQNIFRMLSGTFIVLLLVFGSYSITNDIAREKRRGTLDFIRFSPQSEFTTFTGKMLGVPILLYLFIALAIPLHIIAGVNSHISLLYIFGYYVILISSCLFFFSAAIALTLACKSRNISALPWLISFCVLILLPFYWMAVSSEKIELLVGFFILNPFFFTDYIYNNIAAGLYFLSLPIGETIASLLVISLINYGIWTYCSWEYIKILFRNPNKNIWKTKKTYTLLLLLLFWMWLFTL